MKCYRKVVSLYKIYQYSVFVLLFCLSSFTQAAIVDGFYDIEVPIDTNSEADIKQASALALQSMLVKASGSDAVIQNETLQNALSRANDYVSQFAFMQAETGELSIRFNFTATAIERLLDSAGEPVWAADRPSSLVWMVIDEHSELRVATADDPAFNALLNIANQSGLPFVSPLYDLQDRFTVSAEELWSFDVNSIKSASERYESHHVFVLRALKDSRMEWHISWELIDNTQPMIGSENCLLLSDCLNMPVAQLSRHWAEKYAVTKKYSSADYLAVVLKNASFEKYSKTWAYWRALPAVDQVNVIAAKGKDIHFELLWRSDVNTFKDLVALNPNLMALETSTDAQLVYEWLD